ncbi:MAG: RNA pseudouridine synthase, partial [Flavobacteriales bacterium]
YKQFVQNCLDIFPRQALYARSFGFHHPKTGEWMYFEKELPDDMHQVLERWRNYIGAQQNEG